MIRSAAVFFFAAVMSLHAQRPQPHPALQSQEAFLAELAGRKWECSFTNLPELRFHADKVEVIAGDGKVFNTLSKVSHPEPGIIRVDYNSGFQLFVFADDLESFVLTSMEEQSAFAVEGGAAAPVRMPLAAADVPHTITFTDNPFWKQARLSADKMEVLDGSGNVFATNPAFAYTPQVLGVALPERRVGALILSRQKPGTGWYVNGRNLGVGVRTDKYGFFRTFLRSQLTQHALRSAHFNYPLLIAGKEQMATAQERYAVKLIGDTYGESSDKMAHGLNEMGTLRRNARSYDKAPALHAEALAHARTSLAARNAVLLQFSTDLATSQNDSGDFAGAKKTLAEAYPLLPAGKDVVPVYEFYYRLATAEFGLRNYAVAAQHFIDNSKRAAGSNLKGRVLESLLNLIPCQLAQNQAGLAEATLAQAFEVQKQRQAESKGGSFDTWRLAFACVALGRNKEAMQWTRVNTQRKNWVSYEEYGRLVSLLHGGDQPAAQALAQGFLGRFGDIQEDITVRDDMDTITGKLTLAIAEPTPASIAALEQTWAAQVDSLRDRPLKNYIFARVMVLTLAKLKGR